MKKKFISVSFSILEEKYEMAAAMLSGFPFLGIEERLDEIVITFDLKDWNEELKIQINEVLTSLYPETLLLREEIIDDRNWNEEWEKNVPALIVSERIGIAPQWRINEIDSEIKLIINPKMSFGTGEHATTRLMCQLMEHSVKKGDFWIDAGTGTGALAILAAKLGAKRCFAFDNSFWSVDNAKENVDINQVSEIVEVDEADIDIVELPEADGIAANMNFGLIMRSFEKFRNSLINKRGRLIISGIMIYDKDEVIEKANSFGFHTINFIIEDEWIAFHFSMGN